jgi:hypothetical protein
MLQSAATVGAKGNGEITWGSLSGELDDGRASGGPRC